MTNKRKTLDELGRERAKALGVGTESRAKARARGIKMGPAKKKQKVNLNKPATKNQSKGVLRWLYEDTPLKALVD